MERKIIIGSRGSDLALWQAHFVQDELRALGHQVELEIIKTQGDKIQHLSFDKMEGKGFFTKEIEEALLTKRIDLAVHSHKDLETNPPPGLVVAAVSEREDPAELLLIRPEAVDSSRKFNLKQEALVGTSSARRKMLLLEQRGDIRLKDLRGNVPTRIQKLREGHYDAIVLARAGVTRLKLDLTDFHVEVLDSKEFVPAPAQGVLALQIREEDNELHEVLQALHHTEVQQRIGIERKVLNLFEGGCQLPLGVYCESEGGRFKVWAAMAEAWNTYPKRTLLESTDISTLPQEVVKDLRNQPIRVFISRDLEEGDLFNSELVSKGFHVSGQSLISTTEVVATTVPDAEWVFFSSKNAVRYFLDQHNMSNRKVGAIGFGTAAVLRANGIEPDFIGKGGDTEAIGKTFLSKVGGDKILFPQARVSLRTVQKQLPAAQVIDLVVYETSPRVDVSIPLADVLVFTSPSNVQAYLAQRPIAPGQKLVSIGQATASCCSDLEHSDQLVADTPEEESLVKAVLELVSE